MESTVGSGELSEGPVELENPRVSLLIRDDESRQPDHARNESHGFQGTHE